MGGRGSASGKSGSGSVMTSSQFQEELVNYVAGGIWFSHRSYV